MRKKTVTILIAVCLFFGLHGFVYAQKEKTTKVTRLKDISGEVSGVGKDYISVVYYRNPEGTMEKELLLPVEKDAELVRAKKLDQIKIGDIVDIRYEETGEAAGKDTKIKRRAKVISFMKAAQVKPQAPVFDSESLPPQGTEE